VNILAFIVSFALFVGGLWLMAFAFQTPGLESVTFIGGLLACTLAIVIPVHVLKRID
jgi:hypothetical protein